MPFDQEFYVASPRSEPHVSDDFLRVLIEARQWLSDPERWTQGTAWRDRAGVATTCHNQIGSTCALGAIGMRARVDLIDNFVGPTDYLLRALPRGIFSIPQYNDDPATTHADVLDLFDRAIAARTAELTRLG